MTQLATAAADATKLAESLAEATKRLELVKAMSEKAAKATTDYSSALHAAALIAEQEASVALRKAQAAFDANATAAQRAAKQQEDAGKLYAKAFSEELPEKINNVKDGLEIFSDASADSATRAKALAGSIGIAGGIVGMFAGKMIDLAESSNAAAARLEMLRNRARSVSDAMGSVSRATGGAASEATAYQARVALLNAGMDAGAQSMGAVIEFARQHKRAEEDVSAAIERVIAATQGNAAAQGELGLSVRAGSTAMEAQQQVLAQLEAANRRNGPAAETQAEANARTATGFERAKDSALTFVAAGLGITSMYRGLADLANLAHDANAALSASFETVADAEARGTAAAEASAAVVRQRLQLTQQQAAQGAQRNDELRLAQQELEIRTAQTAVETGLVDIRAEQNAALNVYTQRLESMAGIEQRYQESDKDFTTRRTEAQNRLSEARQRVLDLENRATQERRAHDDLGVMAATLRMHGVQISSQVRSVSIQQQYNHLLQEARTLRQGELETQAQFEARAAATAQALEASRQRMIQQSQLALSILQARISLGRSASDARAAGVFVGRGARSVNADAEAALLEAEALGVDVRDNRGRVVIRNRGPRAGEDRDAYMNRRAGAMRSYADRATSMATAEYRSSNAAQAERDQREAGARQDVDQRVQALGANREQFANQRLGLDQQGYLAGSTQRAYSGMLASGGGAMASQLAQLASFEERINEALSAGTEAGNLRAQALTAEAGALASAIQQYQTYNEELRRANDGSLQMATAFAGSEEAARATSFTMRDVSQWTKGAFDVMTSAAVSHFDALIEGKETAEQAMAGMGREMLKGLATYFIGQAIAQTAAGIGALAEFNLPGAGLHFASAAGFGAAAALAGGIYAATAPPATTEAGKSSTPSPTARSDGGADRNDGGNVTVINNYNGLLSMQDAGKTMVRVLDDADRRGVRPMRATG